MTKNKTEPDKSSEEDDYDDSEGEEAEDTEAPDTPTEPEPKEELWIPYFSILHQFFSCYLFIFFFCLIYWDYRYDLLW